MTDCLETCKIALDKALITKEEFNSVKAAFVKAQQLKAGLDAGLIQPADYNQVRDTFLHTVVNGLTNGEGHSSPNIPSGLTANRSAAQAGTKVSAPAPASNTMPSEARVSGATNFPAAATAVAAQPTSSPAPNSQGTVPIPTNIPDFGGKTAKPQGTSISGIDVSKDASNLYYLIKAKAQYRWALWKIDAAGKQVVIAAVGNKKSSFQEFLAALPPNDCRYAVYDYEYVNSEGVAYNKIMFLNWSPDTANIRSKMMYASTKDFFRSFLDGLSVDFQASELDEIQEEAVHAAVKALVVKA